MTLGDRMKARPRIVGGTPAKARYAILPTTLIACRRAAGMRTGQQEMLHHVQAEQIAISTNVDRRLEGEEERQQPAGEIHARQRRPGRGAAATSKEPGIRGGQRERARDDRWVPSPRPHAEAGMER